MELTDEILESIDVLGGGPVEVSRLPGGLTNQNYKVTSPNGSYVVRMFDDATSALAIDRDHEHRNSELAAEAGVGAPVLAYLPDRHVLVIGYVDGVTLTNESFGEPGMIGRAADACRRLHAGPAFVNEFDMFDVQRRYLAIVQRNGYRLPAGYLDHEPVITRIRDALRRVPIGLVPCNNDLLAANFIDDGTKIWLIDYEYAGNNDPCFELGNIACECRLDADQLDELVTAYFGRPEPDKVARAELLGLVGRYGWALWGSIQAATSPIDFDFWQWGLERYDAALELLGDRRLDRLLDEVQGT